MILNPFAASGMFSVSTSRMLSAPLMNGSRTRPAAASKTHSFLPVGEYDRHGVYFYLLRLPRRRKQRPPKISRRMKLFSRIVRQRLTLSRLSENAL